MSKAMGNLFRLLLIAIMLSPTGFRRGLAAELHSPNNPSSGSVRNDIVVLVNSGSSNYPDFQHYIKPYLDNFGIPYTVLDINSTPVTAAVNEYALIMIGHRQLDTSGVNLQASEQGYIVDAVNAGSGLINFDNDLSADGSSPRYSFIDTIFGFTYHAPATHSGVAFSSLPHYHPIACCYGDDQHRKYEPGRYHTACWGRPFSDVWRPALFGC
jgi:hypothetical protein